MPAPGRECKCHGNEKWKPASFDHTRDTIARACNIAQLARHTAAVATQAAHRGRLPPRQ